VLTVYSFWLFRYVLFFFLNRTRPGMAIKAISQDVEGAKLMGIDVENLNTLAFGIGAALAGIAGALLTNVTLVYPFVGTSPTMKGFVITVLGGMGSIPGAVYGSFIVGLVEAFGVSYISPGYRDAFSFIILILIMILRPSGLFGGKSK
jgi:branched-chain amino acid transport system permease protein